MGYNAPLDKGARNAGDNGTLNFDWIMSNLLAPEVLAIFFMLAAAIVVFSRLRHSLAWTIVLIVLALAGLGVNLPEGFLFHPEQRSIVSVLLTLTAVLLFWVLEKLEAKYIGLDASASAVTYGDFDEDEMVKLNLKDDE